ncbi:MAG: DEAD/DEAH box helicase [Clostridia bacterium]|nr:DEAD/DEAH box helicase [Clostridia bacterium]
MDENRKTAVWDWRHDVTKTTLDKGARYLRNHPFSVGEKKSKVTVTLEGGITVSYEGIPITYDEIGNKGISNRRFQCSKCRSYRLCEHGAAVLMEMEREFGPFEALEPENIWRERVRIERLQATKYRANHFMPPPDGTREPYFNLRAVLGNFVTDAYEEEKARAYLTSGKKVAGIERAEIGYKDGKQTLDVRFEPDENDRRYYHTSSSIVLQKSKLLEIHCVDCHETDYPGGYWLSKKNMFVCSHMLTKVNTLYEFLRLNNPGDETDETAMRLLRALRRKSGEKQEETKGEEGKQQITIIPQYEWEDGSTISVSFLVGDASGKMRMIRKLTEFCDKLDEGSVFTFTGKSTLDLGSSVLDEEGTFWIKLIKKFHGNYGVKKKSYYTEEKMINKILLTGDQLDLFYDIAEGCTIQERNKDGGSIKIGHVPVSIRLKVKPVVEGEDFGGVHITGTMPSILEGKLYQYILTREYLSKVTREDEEALAPYRALSNSRGVVDCMIGNKQFMDFYYRVLPEIEGNALVELDNQCQTLEGTVLPPKAHITFYLDRKANGYQCKVEVTYGNVSFYLPAASRKDAEIRDSFMENEALKLAQRFFAIQQMNTEGTEGTVPEPGFLTDGTRNEVLYQLYSSAIPEMERLGEVQVTDAFRTQKVTPPPQFFVSLSVDNDLLELELLGKEIDEEELRAIFEDFRQKKRFHALKNGNLIDLAQSEGIRRIEDLAAKMNVSIEDILSGKVQVPLYRALFINQLLEERDDTAYSRDKLIRSIVKSFKTIEDSDFEVPASLADIMRPYQTYGYKWMRTLTAFGFGGILADDMGLGKTIQMLSLISALKAEGETGKTLIVCPASLVYNWKAEAERFTPELRVLTMDGQQAARREQIEKIPEDAENDVFVTSYELLRRDIAQYQKIPFAFVVLDEAQYIKTTTATTTKACKVLQAKCRFALTGTPIENRLSELWSIFDFLMPGFLYTHTEFRNKFEVPIMKQHSEEASSQLTKMTSPFILRRLKQNVLSDLPDKLEETREALFDSEQQKLYNAQLLHMRDMLMNLTENPQDKIRILAEITKLRQICCDPSLVFEDYEGESAKRDACLDLVCSAIDGGHKILLFSQFTSMLDLLAEDLEDEDIPFYTITGATPKQERIRLVNKFNSDDVPVFLISLKAGGTGLNLTGADVVIHYDPWWNFAAQNQATDRAHRIGQTKIVTVYKLIAAGTIEEKIVKIQETKRDLADAILNTEGANLMAMSKEELIELFS